jgi:electron transfer flavoprotein beta subunit
VIAVCWKWVTAGDDERWAGVSDADRAALEVAFGLAAATGEDVTVVTAGPPGAERGLREALACGAARVVRIDAPVELESAAAARALAEAVTGASWVVCGDASSDRGSGSVPAFVAAELDVAQALGLVAVEVTGGGLRGVRRLDGGRREVLDVMAPAVVSVEGAAARLRRASLPAELQARRAPVPVVPGPPGPVEHPDAVQPYRPRARALPAPAGSALSRVVQLTDAVGAAATTHELVTLDPPQAAERILAALAEWGYVPPTGKPAAPVPAAESAGPATG